MWPNTVLSRTETKENVGKQIHKNLRVWEDEFHGTLLELLCVICDMNNPVVCQIPYT